MSLRIIPMRHKDANEFVRVLHRHNRPTLGALFCVGVADDLVRGVAICGRPVARHLDDGLTVEILRVCTDGARNACSMLYGACRRIALEMGYQRVITYTLPDEGGGEPKGSRFQVRRRGWEYADRLVVAPRSIFGADWRRSRRREVEVGSMRALLLCLLLGGCSCLTQKVERVEVPVPVVTTCVKDIPPAPPSHMVPGTNIERLAAAASADARELVLYADKLTAILNACKEPQ